MSLLLIVFIYCIINVINSNCGGSYTDSPDWIKNKKATINPINKKDNKCFQYLVTVALNHEEIGKALQRITKIKPFINKHNWEEKSFPSRKDDWKKFEKKNQTIALNVLYAKKEKVYPTYVSKHDSNDEKQVIVLMIPNVEGWHYLVVKKLSVLLRGKTSNHHSCFYCFSCLHYFFLYSLAPTT